jgi:hypothetical protein
MTAVFRVSRRAVPWKLTDVSKEFTTSFIIAMTKTMTAVSNSETSVNFDHTTRRVNPEDSHLHTRRHENLKSHINWVFLTIHHV